MKNLLILTLFMFLSACATSGHDFKDAGLTKLKFGVTTVEEAESLLKAKPVQTISVTDGSQVIVWRYIRSSAFTGATLREAQLLFNRKGYFIKAVQLVDVDISDLDRHRIMSGRVEL